MREMTHYKTILVTLVSVGPLIKGDTNQSHDRRLVSYDRVLPDGRIYDRSSVYFTGESAHHANLRFGHLMELSYYSKSDGSKVMAEYKYRTH